MENGNGVACAPLDPSKLVALLDDWPLAEMMRIQAAIAVRIVERMDAMAAVEPEWPAA